MPKKKKPDNFHKHESLHTTYVLMETFSQHVADSLFIQEDPALKEKADKIVAAMYDLYNSID